MSTRVDISDIEKMQYSIEITDSEQPTSLGMAARTTLEQLTIMQSQ